MSERSAWIVGKGALHRQFLDVVPPSTVAASLDDVPDSTRPVIAVYDDWSMARATRLQAYCRARELAVLPCRVDGTLALAGPLSEPRTTGCVVCAEMRRTGTLAGRAIAGAAAPPLARTLAVVAMALARARLTGQIHVVDGSNMRASRHRFRPHPSCPACGGLPEDAASLAHVALKPRPQDPAAALRSGPPPGLGELREAFVDQGFGLATYLRHVKCAPLASSAVAVVAPGEGEIEVGHGGGATYGFSDQVALLEMLERYAGGSPRSKRTVVRAAYTEVSGDAVNPVSLGLHDPTYRDHPVFELLDYEPQRPCDWVWGYSFRSRAPRLVPEQIAYFRREGKEPGDRFCQETSNGCALGRSREEAILHGLLEVIERDAFLMAWYGRLPGRKIDVGGTHDLITASLLAKIAARGYTTHVFDVTNDFGVPCVWAVARRRDPKATFSAGGADVDPRRAISSALIELACNVFRGVPYEAGSRRRGDEVRRLARCLENPEEVRTVDDHVGLYTLPAAAQRLDFLFAPTDRSTTDGAKAIREWAGSDLRELLQSIIDRTVALGLDVVVVDQTAPEQRSLGLHTMKVIVPGALPMTFGHVYHRTRGLPRLLSVPADLGYWQEPRRYEDLVILPHPFP